MQLYTYTVVRNNSEGSFLRALYSGSSNDNVTVGTLASIGTVTKQNTSILTRSFGQSSGSGWGGGI